MGVLRRGLRSVQAEARGDLAQRLRLLLDRADLTPRQLAAEHDLPYRKEQLYRFFSGELLPPTSLIQLVAQQCGGDLDGLYSVYAQARPTRPRAAAGHRRKHVGNRWQFRHRMPERRGQP